MAAKPSLLPVSAVFDPNQRATFYTVSLEQGGEPVSTYRWSLTTPPGNPTCNKFGPIPGKPNEAVWHHADTDGCTHNGIQHDGTVHVTVLSAHWSCSESFFGTLTKTGAKNERCIPGSGLAHFRDGVGAPAALARADRARAPRARRGARAAVASRTGSTSAAMSAASRTRTPTTTRSCSPP